MFEWLSSPLKQITMNNLSSERNALYNQILGSVRSSPIKTIEYQDNTYHFKLDYKLPFGECHYARIFPKLLYLKECLGIIKPGDVLLETTSGSGGRAAAAAAKALGYEIIIGIPAGGEKSREDSIIRMGAKLLLTPKEAYVNGFPDFIKQFLKENPGTKYLSHVMGDIFGRGQGINGAALEAFRPFVEEVVVSGVVPDFVLCPLGNGTTTLPMVEGFKSLFRKVKVYGFESVTSGYVHRMKHPGKYESVFGINPELFPRHDLPGTTPAKAVFPHPALNGTVSLLDGVGLVTSNHTDKLFVQATGFYPCEKSDWVARWDTFSLPDLAEFGRTGKAGFAMAVKLVEKQKLQGKHFLIPVFDAAWHYDT